MFTPEQRQIFQVEIASRKLCFDPLAVKRKIIEAAAKNEVDLIADFVLLDTDQAVESGALGRIVKVFREVFELPELAKDGTGYLDQDVLSLAESFANFMTGLKKNTETPPTSPTATDCRPDSITNPL